MSHYRLQEKLIVAYLERQGGSATVRKVQQSVRMRLAQMIPLIEASPRLALGPEPEAKSRNGAARGGVEGGGMTERTTIAAAGGNCVECTAPENFFAPDWTDVTASNRALILEHGGLPCEGGGVIGGWCIAHNCHWHSIRPWRDCEAS